MQDGQNLKEEIKAAISVGKSILDTSSDILASRAMTHLRFNDNVSFFRNLSATLQGYLYPSEFSYTGRNDITTAMANRIAINLYETVNNLWLEKIKLEQESVQGSRHSTSTATLKIELPSGVNVLPWEIFKNAAPQQGALQAFILEISGRKLEAIPATLKDLNLLAFKINCNALTGNANMEKIINIIETCNHLRVINMVGSAFNTVQLGHIRQAAIKKGTFLTPNMQQTTLSPADTNQEDEQIKQIVATCAQGANSQVIAFILAGAEVCTNLETVTDKDGIEHEVPATDNNDNTMHKKRCIR
jgi:hypothetical protein